MAVLDKSLLGVASVELHPRSIRGVASVELHQTRILSRVGGWVVRGPMRGYEGDNKGDNKGKRAEIGQKLGRIGQNSMENTIQIPP